MSTEGILSAPYVLEYTYTRSTGPVIGKFLTGLRDKKIAGTRTAAGRVLVPPSEYDPETGDAIDDWVDVDNSGVVTTWTWVAEPAAHHPLSEPFAFALIKLDGADTAMLHAVYASGPDAMKTGMRVVAKWRDERKGTIGDIECFVAEAAQ
jgi:hypothetical protein